MTKGTLIFLASPGTADTKAVTVSVANASVLEGCEHRIANSAGVTNRATISNAKGNGTITDNDTAPSLVIDDVTVDETRSKPAKSSAR